MSVATEDRLVVKEAGIYDIPEADYHRDPVPGGSLSCSIAKRMLAPSCPAIAKWEAEHPVFKDVYDLGSVTHKLILGSGPEIVIPVDDDGEPHTSWNTNSAKDQRTKARERGAVALLAKDMDGAQAMATAVREHPIAGPLLTSGVAEQCVFWQDDPTGIWRRSMLDYLRLDGRPLIVDVKTTPDPAPAAIRKTVENYGYYQQDPYYRDAAGSLGLEDPAFIFVFVGKDPPHLVTVIQLDDSWIDAGRERNRKAIQTWARCMETGRWPGYTDDIETIGRPRWAARNQEDYT